MTQQIKRRSPTAGKTVRRLAPPTEIEIKVEDDAADPVDSDDEPEDSEDAEDAEEADAPEEDARDRKRDPLSSYLKQMGPISEPLEPEEEIELGRLMHKGLQSALRNMQVQLDIFERVRTRLDKLPTAAKAAHPHLAPPEWVGWCGKMRMLRQQFNPNGLCGKKLLSHLEHALMIDEHHEQMLVDEFGGVMTQGVFTCFVNSNLRLVVNIAKRYAGGTMPLLDLIQEGNLGLMHATLRFDYRRGLRFSTYASWWIRHAIGRYLSDHGRTVRIPVHMLEDMQLFAKTKKTMTERLGYVPANAEIGAELKIDQKTMDRTSVLLIKSGLSFDAPKPNADHDPDHTLHDEMHAEPEEAFEYASILPGFSAEETRKAMENLVPIERDIIKRRFGFDKEEEETYKEIGDTYRLSRERIRQLQIRALGKLRATLGNTLRIAA